MSEDLNRYNQLKSETKADKKANDFVSFLVNTPLPDAPELNADVSWAQFKTQLKPASKSSFSVFKIAASVALLIATAFGLFYLNTSPRTQHIATHTEKVEVTFPDGSRGVLNKHSSFTYPSSFGEVRKVSFTGEAYFDIVKRPAPFIIDANGVEVKVLGTAFNLISNKDEVVLYVDRGRVALSKEGSKAEISAGGQATFDKKTNRITIQNTPTPNIMSWRDGYFKFQNTPLAKVVEDLSAYYEMDFQLGNAKLNHCQVTATLDKKPIQEVLKMLEQILNVKAVLKKDSIKISGKGC